MHRDYAPEPTARLKAPPRVTLTLGEGECVVRCEVDAQGARLVLCGPLAARGWVARVPGLDEELAPCRVFVRADSPLTGEQSALSHALTEPGLYEAEAWLSEQGSRQRYRICAELVQGGQLELLAREAFERRLRELAGLEFGEVRERVALYDWERARRATEWLTSPEQRQLARDYVEQALSRWERKLPELQGSAQQLARANPARRRALQRLARYGAGFEPGAGPAREELERAMAWLRRQPSAQVWLGERAGLSGEKLWELYLHEHVE